MWQVIRSCLVHNANTSDKVSRLQGTKYKQSCPNHKEMLGITFSRFRVRFSIGSQVPGRVGLATLPSGGTGAPRNLGPVPGAQNRTIPDTMQWTLLNNPSSLPYPEPAYIEKDQLLQFYPIQQILWYIFVSSRGRPQEWWYLANSSWVYDDDDDGLPAYTMTLWRW